MADEEGKNPESPKAESPVQGEQDSPKADAAGRQSKSPEVQDTEPADEGQVDAEDVNENAGGETEQTDGDKPEQTEATEGLYMYVS